MKFKADGYPLQFFPDASNGDLQKICRLHLPCVALKGESRDHIVDRNIRL